MTKPRPVPVYQSKRTGCLSHRHSLYAYSPDATSYLSQMSLQRHRTYVNVDYSTKPLSGNSWPDSGQSVKFTVGRKHGIRQDKVCIQLVTIQLNECYVVETGTVMGGLRFSSSVYIPTPLSGRTVLRLGLRSVNGPYYVECRGPHATGVDVFVCLRTKSRFIANRLELTGFQFISAASADTKSATYMHVGTTHCNIFYMLIGE